MPTAVVTSKGQLTIPKGIRDAYSIKPGTVIEFKMRKNDFVATPKEDPLKQLKGMFKHSGPAISVDEMSDIRDEYLSDKWNHKNGEQDR
jgi:AbrB family looped-hinge helix DNA binding protein